MGRRLQRERLNEFICDTRCIDHCVCGCGILFGNVCAMTMTDKDAKEFWKQIEQLEQQSDPEPVSRIQKIQQKIKKMFKKIFKSKEQQ